MTIEGNTRKSRAVNFFLFLVIGFVFGKVGIAFSWFLLFGFVALYIYIHRPFLVKFDEDVVSGRSRSNSVDEETIGGRRRRMSKIGKSEQDLRDNGMVLTRTPKKYQSPTRSVLKDSIQGQRRKRVWLNYLVSALWLTWRTEKIVKIVNEMLKEYIISFLEEFRVTELNLDKESAPYFTEIRCLEHCAEKTVLEFDFEWESDSFVEWVMRPKVLPLPFRCILRDIAIEGTARIEISYLNVGELCGTIGEVTVSLTEYPPVMKANCQVFESVDFNSLSSSIPSLNKKIRTKFEEFVNMWVFPHTFTLYQHSEFTKMDKKDNLPLHFGLGSKNLSRLDTMEVEDEIKEILFGINNLLKTKLPQDLNPDQVKVEVCQSVFHFLKCSNKPGKIPVTMMETVKRSFEILNRLAFEEVKAGEVNLAIFNIISKPENMKFIGEVARKSKMADSLVLNIMKLKDRSLQKRVNEALSLVNMKDIIFLVKNRSEANVLLNLRREPLKDH